MAAKDEESQKVPIESVNADASTAPPQDQLFIEKFVRYREGNLPVYVCTIPVGFVKPYSLTYYPKDWPPFLPFIKQCQQEIANKDYPSIWVYQQGRFFIASDDYPTYYAYLEMGHPFIVAKCLGKPDHEAIGQLQGPFYPKPKKG